MDINGIIGAVIDNTYKINEVAKSDNRLVTYNAIDRDGAHFQTIRLVNDLNDSFSKFENLEKFLQKFSLSNIPSFVKSYHGKIDCLIVLKKHEGISLDKYLASLNQKIDYRQGFYFLKQLFLSVDIAARNNICVDLSLDSEILVSSSGIVVNNPLSFEINQDEIIKKMCNLYFKILTGDDFYRSSARVSHYNVRLPLELDKFIDDVLRGVITFRSVENFANTLADKVIFSYFDNKAPVGDTATKSKFTKIMYTLFIIGITFTLTILALIIFIVVPFLKNVYSESSPFNDYAYNDYYDYEYEKIDLYSEENLLKFDEYFNSFKKRYFGYEISEKDILYDADNYAKRFTYYYLQNVIKNKDNYYIKYYDNQNSGNRIYKSSNNKHDELINYFIMNFACTVNDEIYFSHNEDNYYLYSINSDGTDLKCILERPVSHIQTNSAKDKLYFVMYMDEEELIPKLYSSDLDGKNLKIHTDSYKNKDYQIFQYAEMQDVISKIGMDAYEKLNIKYDYNKIDFKFADDKIYYIDDSEYEYDFYEFVDGESDIKIKDAVYEGIIADNKLIYIDDEDFHLKIYDLESEKTETIYKYVDDIIDYHDGTLYIRVFDEDENYTSRFIEFKKENGKYQEIKTKNDTNKKEPDTI